MNAQPPLRVHRLAAVWFADIVGYTRLSSEDEAAALRLVDLLQESAREVIDRFGGRLVKFIGDSALADFSSTEVAVRAALTLRSQFASRCHSAGLPAQLRIGIHVGDVVSSSDGDIYGDGVNTASRLQAAARPGQVLVTEDVWRQLRQRPEFHFDALGERTLKGAAGSIRIFSIGLREDTEACSAETSSGSDGVRAGPRATFSDLVEQLRCSRAFRVAVIYVVVGSGVVGAANHFFPTLELPGWSTTLVATLVVLGFPIALVLAWASESALELPSTRAPSPRLLQRWWAPIGAGLLAALLTGLALWSSHHGSPLASHARLDGSLLAVAPFNVASSDPELQQWEEYLVDILARNLDGAGPLRTVSPSISIRRWRGPADPASAAVLGKQTGAGLVVFGSLIPSGQDSARLTASIFDVARSRVLDEVVIEVHEPGRQMVQLSDSLTVALLHALGRERPIGAVRHASLGSLISGPALKAFLRGEQFYRRTAWDSAIAHYERTLEADSTFALAHRRIGLALSWQGTVTDSVSLAYKLRAGAYNRGLPPRDSLLVAADSLSAAAQRIEGTDDRAAVDYWSYIRRLFATLEEVTRRYPRDPEGWYALGEARYHFGFGPAAVTEREILDTFDRVIELDPEFAPGYLHPIELGFKLGGRSLGLRYAQAYLALDPTDINAEGVRLVRRLADPQQARLPETQRLLASASVAALGAARRLLDQWPDSLETAMRLSELREIKLGGDPAWRARCTAYQPNLARQLAYRGHLMAARCALGEDPPPSKLLAELALLGGIPADSASRMFDRWLEQGSSMRTFTLPWWAMRGDTVHIQALLQQADSAARAAPDAGGRLRASYDTAAARAYLALARADTAEALRRFAALPDTLCFFCFGLDRLTEARLLAATERHRDAEEILNAWRGPSVFPSDMLFELEGARIAERLGHREQAITAYRYVADAWAHAGPLLRPVVIEARTALERLQGKGSRGGIQDPLKRRRPTANEPSSAILAGRRQRMQGRPRTRYRRRARRATVTVGGCGPRYVQRGIEVYLRKHWRRSSWQR